MFRANPNIRSAKNDLQNTIQSQDTTPLLCSTSASKLLFPSLLYSASTLPLVYLWSTSSLPLLPLRRMPAGDNDLGASENVTS